MDPYPPFNVPNVSGYPTPPILVALVPISGGWGIYPAPGWSWSGQISTLTPAPSLWQFGTGQFAYKGTWYPLTGQRLDLLKAFVLSNDPYTLTHAKIEEVCSRGYKTQRLYAYVSELNATLRKLMGLDTYPISSVHGTAYRLDPSLLDKPHP
jgi:hypothetical protein